MPLLQQRRAAERAFSWTGTGNRPATGKSWWCQPNRMAWNRPANRPNWPPGVLRHDESGSCVAALRAKTAQHEVMVTDHNAGVAFEGCELTNRDQARYRDQQAAIRAEQMIVMRAD